MKSPIAAQANETRKEPVLRLCRAYFQVLETLGAPLQASFRPSGSTRRASSSEEEEEEEEVAHVKAKGKKGKGSKKEKKFQEEDKEFYRWLPVDGNPVSFIHFLTSC